MCKIILHVHTLKYCHTFHMSLTVVVWWFKIFLYT